MRVRPFQSNPLTPILALMGLLLGMVAVLITPREEEPQIDVTMFDQSFVKNDKQTVAQMLKANGTTVKSFTLYVVGEGIEKKVDDFAAEVAAQVALAKQSA